MSQLTPTLLLILDGWGLAPEGKGNGVILSNTPNLDRISKSYPSTTLKCSGRAVGLPEGFMGNSEVGHMNLGAGRVVYQDMTRIDMAIEQGTFASCSALAELLQVLKEKDSRLHLMGLLSDGGVHSHLNHLYALLEAAKRAGVPAYVHAFADGRDTGPEKGIGFMKRLVAKMQELGWGQVASVTGRYYAMDRDSRWERIQLAYEGLTEGKGQRETDPVELFSKAYAAGEYDEFIKPRILTQKDGSPVACIEDGDGLFFFNFRADRARQISRTLFDDAFDGFSRAVRPTLAGFATMTEYESSFPLPAAFPPEDIHMGMGEVVSGLGVRQLRIAETEKYAHVTYFFNGGREEPFEGEDRKLIPSPREVATYDQKPEMSAYLVADAFEELWSENSYSFAVLNLANFDMVGHTGSIPAVVQAGKAVDACAQRIIDAVLKKGGRVLLTADHGNAEQMLDADGGPHTAHSMNPVPLYLIENEESRYALKSGKLGDIAPTILGLWGVTPPAEMTGEVLLEEK
ncbi:2,3-bisphosphoglycerate-independent phosphoglycerate mutase [Desulfobaculum bizertense]|uniref:2,3-bisphosphoglycerate-independent phosphoglycerate mutase n=1 Tax=Desulfobaculum bizertense TaxID=376490 RepID=UPI001F414244|nr:2,3-bisphosphoglycerate-independent phosphoglycerate mutase [Desulfobaculum bizertense]UIJ38599.1 2,3-bisphosphoglycerate-independent phosphoglycerate mutase [Desulfobaculum bizertense]